MNDIQRIFLAVTPDPQSHQRLSRARSHWEKDLGPDAGVRKIRWLAPQDLHLTLFFLGDVAESRLPEIVAELSLVEVPRHLQPLTQRLGLPDPRAARVLAVGSEKPVSALTEFVGKMGEALQRLGFIGEERAFLPHVSLGRVKPSLDLSSTLSHPIEAIEFLIQDFVIFKSGRHTEGSEYREIRRLPLRGRIL